MGSLLVWKLTNRINREFSMPCIRIIYEIFPEFFVGIGKENYEKKTLKKLEEETPFFSRSYIVSRINYNLLSAKTLFAITFPVLAKMIYPVCKL